jgi:60S ribosomal protein uL30
MSDKPEETKPVVSTEETKPAASTEAAKTAAPKKKKTTKKVKAKCVFPKLSSKVKKAKASERAKAKSEEFKANPEKAAALRKEKADRKAKLAAKKKGEKVVSEKKKVTAEKKEGATDKKEAKKAPVPESILKKRAKAKKTQQNELKKKHRIQVSRQKERRVIFKRAESYAKRYRAQDRAHVKLRRLAKNGGNFFREPEPKIAIVVRIRGINGVDPKTRKILQLFRLRQIHNATFVKLNAATLKMLRLVEPYVAYGTPNLKTVRHLLYKRGYLKVHGQRIPICSNGPIIQKFKKINLICIEDLIHQIFTCGRHFKKVNKNLWPFKLSSPKGGYSHKTSHFQEGGDAGNREEKINAFIQKMI